MMKLCLVFVLGLSLGFVADMLRPKPSVRVCLTYEDLQGVQTIMDRADESGITSGDDNANQICTATNWWITTYRLKEQK